MFCGISLLWEVLVAYADGWGKAFKRKRDAHMVVHPADVFFAYMGHDGTRLSCYRHAMHILITPLGTGKICPSRFIGFSVGEWFLWDWRT